MKMVQGGGGITNWGQYIYNCTLGQWPYKIPASNLEEFFILYIGLGTSAPGSITYQLIWTCGAGAGTIENLTPADYVIGQDTNGKYYMVINGFNESTSAPCFVIGITVDGTIYFSQEYCLITSCDPAALVQGCYGNLDPLISYDREGIYFGKSQGGTQGNANLVYKHQFIMYNSEITLNAIKNEYKQGRTRNFRTESTDIFQLWGDLIPEWYIRHVDAVFKRGEIYFTGGRSSFGNDFIQQDPNTTGVGKRFIVNSTAYEKVDECFKSWKPTALLQESQYQSFSCEPDPCAIIEGSGGGGGVTECCDPVITGATVESNGEGGQLVTVNFNPCSPSPANGYTVFYRIQGSGGAYILADTGYSSSPATFNTADPDGTQYEGYIFSDCGDGVLGGNVFWNTGTANPYSLSVVNCSGGITSWQILGGTPGDLVTIRASYSGLMQKIGNNFVRADLTINGNADMSPTSQIVSSACFPDTNAHGFSLTADSVITIDGTGTAFFTTIGVVNNSSDSFNALAVSIIDINGSDPGITVVGCDGNSSTGGTC